MSLTQTAAQSATGFGRYHFLLRRLHSLSGIVPVGVFVIFHLMTNFQLLTGTFEREVHWIHTTLPVLEVMELSIWLGIGFHAVLGLYYTFVGTRFVEPHYRYLANWRYTLQRITGIIALVFIFLHIWTLRWRLPVFDWYTPFDPANATASTAYALQYAWWVAVIYLVGALCVVYHWANGLWTAAITWGLTISEAAMKRWGRICLAIGLILAVFTVGSVIGALRYELTDADQALIKQVLEHGVSHQH